MMNAALLVITTQISALIKGTQSVASTKLEAPKPTPSMTRQVAHPMCLFAAVNSATCIKYVDAPRCTFALSPNPTNLGAPVLGLKRQ
jgi:hypothetical protein